MSDRDKVPPSICGDPNQTRADRWRAKMDDDQKKRLGKAGGAGIEIPGYMDDSWREADNVSVFPDPVDRATAIVNSALWDAREQEPDATATRIARRVAMYLDAAGALESD